MWIEPTIPMIAPFAMQKGLSYVSFGELLQGVRELGPGRYPVTNGEGTSFHLVLYEDASWRISTPQLPLFSETSAPKAPHTLT